MLGCERSRQAVVVDPNLDLEQYVDAARAEGVSISDVTETHIHADFASGACALATLTGATLHVSDEGGADWQYDFAHAPAVRRLRDGDRITVGAVELVARHTPGHTPEHLSFVVTDTARSDLPVGALTGDFVFVGDVGRPDLLERAVGQSGTMRAAAAQLYASIRRTRDLPDHLQIWPGHGAGSACGKALGSSAQSTLGYERAANWAFAPMSESEFIDRVLEGQPTAPAYFGAMKLRNKRGVIPRASALPRRVLAEHLASADRSSLSIIDVREADEWARGHIDGAQHVPLAELDAHAATIPPDTTIVVHCQRGARSAHCGSDARRARLHRCPRAGARLCGVGGSGAPRFSLNGWHSASTDGRSRRRRSRQSSPS